MIKVVIASSRWSCNGGGKSHCALNRLMEMACSCHVVCDVADSGQGKRWSGDVSRGYTLLQVETCMTHY